MSILSKHQFISTHISISHHYSTCHSLLFFWYWLIFGQCLSRLLFYISLIQLYLFNFPCPEQNIFQITSSQPLVSSRYLSMKTKDRVIIFIKGVINTMYTTWQMERKKYSISKKIDWTSQGIKYFFSAKCSDETTKRF